MANPKIPQGTLNRLFTSIVWDDLPSLNITPAFLAPEQIEMTLEGTMTDMLPTSTGFVTSPNPFMPMRLVIHLVRAQGIADAYKSQWELNTLIGNGTLRGDVTSSVLAPFIIENAAITGLNTIAFSGRDAGFVVTCTGAYNINSGLWA